MAPLRSTLKNAGNPFWVCLQVHCIMNMSNFWIHFQGTGSTVGGDIYSPAYIAECLPGFSGLLGQPQVEKLAEDKVS